MRCFFSKFRHEGFWKRSGRCGWKKVLWKMRSEPFVFLGVVSGSGQAGSVPMGSVPVGSDPERPSDDATEGASVSRETAPLSRKEGILNRITGVVFLLCLMLLAGGWGRTVIAFWREDTRQANLEFTPDQLGIPSALILEEGQQKLPWLANYKLEENSPTGSEGGKPFLVVSSFQTTPTEAFHEARQFVGNHLLQRFRGRGGNARLNTIPQEVILSSARGEAGLVEKTIRAGEFSSPMYRAYLMATISPSHLDQLERIQQETVLNRNAVFLLISIGIGMIFCASMTIALWIDLGTQGRLRWAGNLLGSACLLGACGATMMIARMLT